jgi:predicted metalloprotease with PDZ domain
MNPPIHLLLALSLTGAPAPQAASLRYTVNLNDRADSVFKVTLRVDSLPAASGVFQFASTAPGTYQVMDIGRYVRRFRAFDATGREVATTRLNTNQWQIASPSLVRVIRYDIRETFDTPVTEHPVYRMCGSSLKADHALINGQAVFGFPRGMQAVPISVRLLRPPAWVVGTPLRQRLGLYLADDYDQLVDSPILAGRLTRAETRVTGVPVQILVYSRTGQIKAPQLLTSMRGMLQAAGEFLGKLPVDRYTFLFHFSDRNMGAWEHSYGSEYALQDRPYTRAVGTAVTDMAAHEFFHVVTPLNIHSEIIEHFNFETPVPSRHLWLYEGVTEWAAHKMLLESGLKSEEEYLAGVVQKVRIDRLGFDTTYSLTKLALTSYSDSGQRQYGNIYMRGAVVAGLLDIDLLELSDGQHGLRDLIAGLSKTYGKKRAFPEDSLLAILGARTSPPVRDFLSRYVEGAEHPPIKEFYAKLGFRLIEDAKGLPVRFEVDSNATPAQLKLRAAWLGRRGAPVS